MVELSKIVYNIITRGLENFGIFYSEYRGIVVDINDPENLHRVKLQVPQVAGDYTINYWAWPKGIPSTPNSGFQMIPQKGEMVWVSFEMGNPRRPMWTYGYRGTEDYNDPELHDPKLIWFKTKAGNLIVVDDSKKLIRIESANGRVVEISDTISIGTKGSSDESAVLGETLESLLKEVSSILRAAKVNTMLGPQPFLPDTLLKLETWEAKVKNIKSKTVTLDK